MIKNILTADDDFSYLHEGNHNERGNPHSQYVLVNSTGLVSQTELVTNKYIKVCTATINKNMPNVFNFKFLLSMYGNGTNINSGMIDVVVRYNGSVNIVTSGSVLKGSVVGVVNSDTNNYIVDIYARAPYDWTVVFAKPFDKSAITYDLAPVGNVTYCTNQSFISALPTGTQVIANYNLSNSNLSSNGYKKFGDGYIEQWGTIDGSLTTGKATGTITFPTSFETECYYISPQIVMIDTDVTLLDNTIITANTYTTTNAQFRINQTAGYGSTFRFKYFAVGK